MDFEGFSTVGRDFLRELPTRDKAWFDANRATYTREVADPAKAFVDAMTEALREHVSPGLEGVAKVNGSISPINRDIRFSADKTPYKDHLLMKWWEGPEKKTARTLHIRLAADEIGFATGAMLADLDRWRELVADERTGPSLADAVAELVAQTGADVAGADYKRVPKPYPADHPGVTCSGTSGSRSAGPSRSRTRSARRSSPNGVPSGWRSPRRSTPGWPNTWLSSPAGRGLRALSPRPGGGR